VDKSISAILQRVDYVEKVAKDLVKDLNPPLPHCFEVYIRNAMLLRIASYVRRGRDIDIDRLAAKFRKLLSARDRVEILTRVCNMYRNILTRKPQSIADIGCGLGLNLNIAKKYIKEDPILIGIDKDLYFLKILKKLSPDVEVTLADASMLPLRSSSIDIAFCTTVLHELSNLEIIKEMSRTLRDNGTVFLSDIVIRFIPSWILKAIRILGYRLSLKIEIPYTLNQIVSNLKSNSMIINELYTYWKLLIIGIAVLITVKKSQQF